MLGLGWLVNNSDWTLFISQWTMVLLILAVIFIFNRMRYYIRHSLHGGHVIGAYGDFTWVILWASVLVLGHTIIWLFLFRMVLELILSYRRAVNQGARLESLRTASLSAAMPVTMPPS